MNKFARLFGMGSNDPALNSSSTAESEDTTHEAVVQEAKVEIIVPNPFQPRKIFNNEALQELAASIGEHGILQPLIVRRTSEGFEIIAGERRLRAAKIAQLTSVPVIVKDIDDKEMAELAMIENLQREDLHYLEEAEGFQHLLANFGFTQEELAKRVGKNQSTIANKLRLLRLAPPVREALVDEHLTERHARALLKLEDPLKQQEAFSAIRQNQLNVREAEQLIEGILDDISRENAKKAPRQNIVKVIRDVRIFINTINSVVAEMKKVGLKVKVIQSQDEEYITINMRIPKRRK